MKLKLNVFFLILIGVISIINLSFAESDRLVDIPVPPNSTGYADFTEEEAAQRGREYEESKNNAVTADYFVGKSSDNYLKSLNIEGYDLYPEFNKQNDAYTIYVEDDRVNNFNVNAEPDNENAKIEGIGNVTVSQEQKIINVKVTAENGDLKVYTINIENEENNQNNSEGNINIILIVVIAIVLIIILIVVIKKKKIAKKVE